jgi:hypothetical protein
MSPNDRRPDEPDPPPTIACPWCAYTDVVRKEVLHHMESTHHQRWCDLELSPLIAGKGPM